MYHVVIYSVYYTVCNTQCVYTVYHVYCTLYLVQNNVPLFKRPKKKLKINHFTPFSTYSVRIDNIFIYSPYYMGAIYKSID